MSKSHCWILNCIEVHPEDLPSNYEHKDIYVKINDKITKHLVCSLEKVTFEGWVIDSLDLNDKANTYPASDTWGEWDEIENDYQIFNINSFDERLWHPAFLSEEEAWDYVENKLPKIVKDILFKW